jgi:hypothetical protein
LILANTLLLEYTNAMYRWKHILLLILTLCTGLFVSIALQGQALAVEFRKPVDTYTIKVEYYNDSSADKATYVAGLVENSVNSGLASGSVFEVSQIKNTYPLLYTTARGLTTVSSGDIKTETKDIKPSEATFVNSQNQLSWILTPNNDNRCAKLTDVKGCVWDIGKKNQWDPDTLGCLGGAKLTCAGDKLNVSEANKLGAGFGGRYEITLKIKGGIDKESLSYFPTQIYQYSPGSSINRSNNLFSGITVFLTDRAVASVSTPSSSSVSSSSVSSSAVSSSASSSASSVSSSSSSSIPAPATSPLSRTDVTGLDIFCKDGVVSTQSTCSFTLPAGKTLPASLRISVDTGAGVSCTAKGPDVECSLVQLSSTAGKKAIFVAIDTVKVDTLKKVTVVAQTQDLVRSGAGDTASMVFLAIFAAATGLAVWIVNKPRSIKQVRF